VQPQDLLYAKTHEWADLHQQGPDRVATVGLSHFAVEALTDLVFLELPDVGRQVKAGESFGEIESVKAVSDLYSPVTGEVIDVNRALPDNLEAFLRRSLDRENQGHRRIGTERSDGSRSVRKTVRRRGTLIALSSRPRHTLMLLIAEPVPCPTSPIRPTISVPCSSRSG